jgi:hypothetical protein
MEEGLYIVYCENWVNVWIEYCDLKAFWSGIMISIRKITTSDEMEKHMYLMEQ